MGLARDGELPPDNLPEGARRDFPQELLTAVEEFHGEFRSAGNAFKDASNDEGAARRFQTAAVEKIGQVFDALLAGASHYLGGKPGAAIPQHDDLRHEVANGLLDVLTRAPDQRATLVTGLVQSLMGRAAG